VIDAVKTLTASRIERRAKPGGAVRYRIGSVAIGVALSTAFALLVSDADPGQFFEGLWNSTFGQPSGFEDMLTLTASLLLVGLAAAIPLKIGLWNIGADGQLFLGAWGAFAMGRLFPDMNSSLLIPLMFVAAAVCGAAWSIIPALARVYLNVNEIISTLLFNFIAASWVIYWAGAKWGEEASAGSVKSESVPSQTIIESILIGDYLIPIGFVAALIVGAVIWLFLRRSVFGYEMSIIGSSPKAATYAGMPTKRIMIAVFALGGVAAGLAGVVEMLTNVQRYGPALSNNTGYTGVVVAVLAGGFGPQLLAMALVFAIIAIAGNVLTITGAPSELVFAMYGLTLICAAIGQGLRHVKIVNPARGERDGPAVAVPEGAK
jgi:general nucleoside transport system permease protein